jgi:hypothetical protein
MTTPLRSGRVQKDSRSTRDGVRATNDYQRTIHDPRLRNAVIVYARSTR